MLGHILGITRSFNLHGLQKSHTIPSNHLLWPVLNCSKRCRPSFLLYPQMHCASSKFRALWKTTQSHLRFFCAGHLLLAVLLSSWLSCEVSLGRKLRSSEHRFCCLHRDGDKTAPQSSPLLPQFTECRAQSTPEAPVKQLCGPLSLWGESKCLCSSG